MRKTIVFLCLMVTLPFHLAFCSQLFLRKLSEVVPQAKIIIKGTILSFEETNKEEDVITSLPYLAHGEKDKHVRIVTETCYKYGISVEKVLLGKVALNEIKAIFTQRSPYLRDRDNPKKIVGHFSPIVDCSSLEGKVEVGKEYIILFARDIIDENTSNHVMRIEFVDKQAEIESLLSKSK